MMIFDFTQAGATADWQPIDDRIMGGVSRSDIKQIKNEHAHIAVFSGTVSPENNGGFCSVRASLGVRLQSGTDHIWISCFNSPDQATKIYHLNLRTSNDFDGLNYRASFQPTTTLDRYPLTASQFTAVYRGRLVKDAAPLRFSDVRQIGLMVSSAQHGPFKLFINSSGMALT